MDDESGEVTGAVMGESDIERLLSKRNSMSKGTISYS